MSLDHIEFIGQSGAGKSTILSELLESDKFIGGEQIYRKLFCKCSKTELTKYLFPRSIQNNIGEFLWRKHFQQKWFVKFVYKNPHCSAEGIEYVNQQHAQDEPEYLERKRNYMVKAMAKLEFTKHLAAESQYPCLSEGFYHKAAVSATQDNLPSESYFETIPQPSHLIYIDVHPEIARKRTIKRDGYARSQKRYNEGKELLEKIVNIAQNMNVNVITLKNRGGIRQTVETIRSEILNTSVEQ